MSAMPENSAIQRLGPKIAPPTLGWHLPVETARVRLRLLRLADLKAFHAYRADPVVSRYQGWTPMTQVDGAAFIEYMAGISGPVRGGWVQIGIALAETNALIGDVGLHVTEDGLVEIGFSCARPFQGHGYASEAVRLLLDLVFRSVLCKAVRAVVDERNEPCIRLLERLGFSRVDSVEAVFRGEPCIERVYLLNAPCGATNG